MAKRVVAGESSIRGTAENDGRKSAGTVGGLALSGGSPLEPGSQEMMEKGFGVSFDSVRIHADTSAAESAQQLGALAYTYGRDIAFAQGQYAPMSAPGRLLLAHELAHVVQQREEMAPTLLRQPNPAAMNPNPGCDDLLGLIKEAVAVLIARAADLVNDPLGLQWDNWNVPKILADGTDVGSVVGHQQQYEGWRNRLRNLIDHWDDDDCNQSGKRVPKETRDLRFAPTPVPIPRPRPDTDPKPWEAPGAHRIAETAKGAAIGGTIGLVLGGIIGAVAGGGGGTLVAPGVGTVGGGVAGAIAGAEIGAQVGVALGVAVGGLIGWLSGD